MANYISSVKLPGDNTSYIIRDRTLNIYSGICSTAAATEIKDVTCPELTSLTKGAVVFVTFTYTNTAAVANLKLRVNSSAAGDAKPLKHQYNASESNIPDKGYIRADQTYQFYYDGTNWVMVTDYNTNTNTTYTIATGDNNGQIKVTPSSGNAYNVSVKGLDSAAYTSSTDYSYKHLSDYNFTDTQPLSKYVTFDKSKPVGAPKEEWYNGFISSHSNYHASYIINGHTNQNEWYVGHGIWREANTPHATAPTWYLLAHSGNVTTGDSNGQVKIAGVNVDVKGLGSAAYTASTAYAPSSHNHAAEDITSGTLNTARLPDDVVKKRGNLNSITTEVELVKLNPGIYNHTTNPNSLLPTGYGTIFNSRDNYKYGALIATETDNNFYYRAYYYNTDSDWTWRGQWQMVAHADKGTAVGNNTTPIYITNSGVITAGTALKDLAYIAKGSGSTKFLREDGTWQTALTSHQSLSAYAPLNSPTFTGTPKSVTPTSTSDDTMIATKAYVDGYLAVANALVYKGVVAGAATGDNNAYGALTPAANCGDTYKISTAGFINGLRVEIGDMLICTTDNTPAATASGDNIYSTIRNNWNIIQTSEGSVSTSNTLNESNTNKVLAYFDGTSGRIIKSAAQITYYTNEDITVQSTTKKRNGLRFYGATYGNTASDLQSNTKGVMRYEDGGPRLEFSEVSSGGSDNGALLFTNHDSANTGGGSSFHFVGQNGSNNTGGNLAVTAPDFVARRRLMVGKNFTDTNYVFYSNGATYINGATTINSNLDITAGTIYFGKGATNKAILAYNSNNTKFGIWYYESDPDVMRFSASGNADSNTTADFAINALGAGILSNRNNYIPHTGNTTGSVGGTTTPVYVDGGQIKALSYTIAKSVPSDAVFTDHYAWGDITNKPTSIALTGAVTATATTLGSGAISITTTVNHGHGYISSTGQITETHQIANGDRLIITDSANATAEDKNKLIATTIKFDGSTATKALTQKGTWETFNNYSHPTGDGNLHVPPNGTGNNGKFLQATGTAGTYQWASVTKSTVGLDNVTNDKQLPIAGGTMTGDITFTATTFSSNPTDSKGLVWSGGTDGTKIFYRQTANNAGSLVLQVSDDGEEYINFRHTAGGMVYLKPNTREFYPNEDNKGSIGTSSYKWANMYATTFNGALIGNVTGNVSGSSGSCTGNAASATKVAAKLAADKKTYLLGTQTTITGTTANVELTGDTNVYLHTSSGGLSATEHIVNDGAGIEKVSLKWNSTDLSLDFIFI